MPDTRLVYVADREADFIDLMAQAQALGTPADWLIRSVHNRKVAGRQDKMWEGKGSARNIAWERFASCCRRNGGQAAREVVQQLSVDRCSIVSAKGVSIAVTALRAVEIGAPPGVKPIEWKLLTNRLVETLEAATELIDWYRCRWEIEMFFNVLKTARWRRSSCRRSNVWN